MTTNVVNHLSTSSSNLTPLIAPLDSSSLLNTQKFPTTFIIQPPSSSQTQASTLLNKRQKPTELGDLLLKKIKTQTNNSSASDSNQASPTIRQNYEDAVYDSSEAGERSLIKEGASPSTKSLDGEREMIDVAKSDENPLIPQRSLSTPVVYNSLFLRSFRGGANDSQRQLQNALESLQKKILIEQKTASLRDVLLKIQACQKPLIIPPLMSLPEMNQGSTRKIEQDDDDELEIIYGEVEYPLLSLLAPRANTEGVTINAPNSSSKRGPRKINRNFAKLSDSSSTNSDDDVDNESLLESLTVTRAGTQKSELEMALNLSEISKEFTKATKDLKIKNKNDTAEKGGRVSKKAKESKKDKTMKSRQQKKDELLKPIVGERRVTDRKKNKL